MPVTFELETQTGTRILVEIGGPQIRNSKSDGASGVDEIGRLSTKVASRERQGTVRRVHSGATTIDDQ